LVQISFIASICSRIFFGRVSSHIPGELKQALDKAAAKYELKVFSGTQYGFCFLERAVFDTIAAEETWTKIFAMWDRNLK
jgi:dienelactone hydrolase